MLLQGKLFSSYVEILCNQIERVVRQIYGASVRSELNTGKELLQTVWIQNPESYDAKFIQTVKQDIAKLESKLRTNESRLKTLQAV